MPLPPQEEATGNDSPHTLKMILMLNRCRILLSNLCTFQESYQLRHRHCHELLIGSRLYAGC